MDWRKERAAFALAATVFIAAFYLPVGTTRFDGAVLEAFHLVKWYAREHVIFCLVPAFFIAGGIGVFVSQGSVMRYLGPAAKKTTAYGVASVSGSILAVCSCTVLPLFAGIYRMGAGLGPAVAFLYAGPAINVLAIILTARILGASLGFARAAGAVVFSIVIGLCMHFLFRREELSRTEAALVQPEAGTPRPLHQNVVYFTAMIGVLVFANWSEPASGSGAWSFIHAHKWILTGLFAAGLGFVLTAWFGLRRSDAALAAAPVVALALLFPGMPMLPFGAGVAALSAIAIRRGSELGEWLESSWGFAKQILPLLFAGVLAAGLMLGRPGGEGLIPSQWISSSVGGNGIGANLFAAFAGAFMYFATLTEVPILQGLIGSGMGKGPALALLLAGPALSLPNMLVIRSVLGTKKTAAFVVLVVVMAAVSGFIYGAVA